jgi:hypothetical protein
MAAIPPVEQRFGRQRPDALTPQPGEDIRIDALDRVWFVRRSHAMIRRVEQQFGPAIAVARRLDTGDIAQDDLAMLLTALLADHAEAPRLDAVRAWLLDAGTITPAKALCVPVAMLTMSRQEIAALRALVAERMADARKSEGDETGPFSPTAASTGPTTSRRP